MYVYLLLSYIWGSVGAERVPDYLGLWYLKVLFYPAAVIQIMFVLMITLLGVMHHVLILNNTTTIEMYKGASLSWVPCICVDYEAASPYDEGIVGNYIQVFGKSFGEWLWPVSPDNIEWEVEVARAPEITEQERAQYADLIVSTLAEPPDPRTARTHPEKSLKSH